MEFTIVNHFKSFCGRMVSNAIKQTVNRSRGDNTGWKFSPRFSFVYLKIHKIPPLTPSACAKMCQPFFWFADVPFLRI